MQEVISSTNMFINIAPTQEQSKFNNHTLAVQTKTGIYMQLVIKTQITALLNHLLKQQESLTQTAK